MVEGKSVALDVSFLPPEARNYLPFGALYQRVPLAHQIILPGKLERAHHTHTEEFYEVTESSFDIAELRSELLEWKQVYKAIRPHQALGYLPPLKFLEQWKQRKGKEVMCH